MSTKSTAGDCLYSVIIPVYRNAEFIPLLISEFGRIRTGALDAFGIETEFVFVVDGSPDNCYALLRDQLPQATFRSQLVLHARNFGSFAAMRTGLHAAKGAYFAVIAADLQEPPEILLSFLGELLSNQHDIVIGVRTSREDPALSLISANLFWRLYRKLVVRDMPKGGADIFACTRQVRNELLKLEEAHSSLVGLIFWLGFRRGEVAYSRRARAFGKSAWTFRKKLTYLLDSIFSFTDLPIRILTVLGAVGLTVASALSAVVFTLRITGAIKVPGYTALVLIVLLFGALNTLGLGLIGSYIWRAYENTKRRPLAVVQECSSFIVAGAENTAISQPRSLASEELS